MILLAHALDLQQALWPLVSNAVQLFPLFVYVMIHVRLCFPAVVPDEECACITWLSPV